MLAKYFVSFNPDLSGFGYLDLESGDYHQPQAAKCLCVTESIMVTELHGVSTACGHVSQKL